MFYNLKGDIMHKKIYLIASIIFIIDQITKYFISTYLKLESSIKIIKDFFYIRYIKNYGASWGILENNRLFLILVSIFSIVIIIKYLKETKDTKLNILGYGFLLGGIIGNLFDRIIFGYVKDFLDFYIFKYNYPVFNIADTFIVIGALLIIISIIKGEEYGVSSTRKRKLKNR